MGKVIAFLAVVGIVAGFLAGVVLALRVDTQPIVLAVATQQAARADSFRAEADAERARAAQAWARAREADTRAAAVRDSLPQLTLGLQALAVGLPVVLLVILAGFGWAGWRWAHRQANIFYPRAGVSPVLMVEQHGAVYLVDTGRGLGSVTAIDAAGRVRLPLAGPADVHAQLSAQSLAAAVIAQAAGTEAKAQAAAAVGRAVQDTLASLPALAQGHSTPSIVFSAPKKDDTIRIIPRNTATPKADADAVKRGQLCEYLKHGDTIGFTRRAWAGKKFADGEICTQSLWAKLNAAARKANVLTDDGQKLRAGIDETLAHLGLTDAG